MGKDIDTGVVGFVFRGGILAANDTYPPILAYYCYKSIHLGNDPSFLLTFFIINETILLQTTLI